MKYLKKFNTLGSAITWDRTGNNSRVSPITYFIEESGQVLYREYVNMTPNGHDFVDLGLPSGTLWATMNLGASNMDDCGNYYAWGETSTKSSYTLETYSYYLEDSPYYTQYNDEDKKVVLEEDDDAAHVLWGGGWHIPTIDQIRELIDSNYTTILPASGTNGNKINIFSRSNNNCISLPLTGYKNGENIDDSEASYFQCSGLYMGYDYYTDGFCGYISGSSAYAHANNSFYRGYGFPIRPVLGDKNYVYSDSGFTEK